MVSNGGSYVDGDDCGATDVGTLRAGDLNGDGKPDLLFNNSIRLGTGAGSFSSATPIDFGPEFMFMDLFDLNGDGNLDAIGNSQGLLAAKLGNGRGGFRPRQLWPPTRWHSARSRTSTGMEFWISFTRIIWRSVLRKRSRCRIGFDSSRRKLGIESNCHPRCKGR